MVNAAYALNAYTQTKVTTTDNPVDLVIMLYDGAIEFLEKAVMGIEIKSLQIKIKYITKTFAIIEELDKSLNFEGGGQVAVNLADLYFYMMRELVLANLEDDAAKIRHIISLLKELREAWIQIKNKA
ncbi:MAG: flagellar export chaperone FliS [Nitrospirae bacterium]|nr:flagellar export chaperone FliS [Nitrospirota bacterium]MCL5237263.1 flagellar export chaperone FliS [Nitrospirota bacterium]